jgi:hypothetical protein
VMRPRNSAGALNAMPRSARKSMPDQRPAIPAMMRGIHSPVVSPVQRDYRIWPVIRGVDPSLPPLLAGCAAVFPSSKPKDLTMISPHDIEAAIVGEVKNNRALRIAQQRLDREKAIQDALFEVVCSASLRTRRLAKGTSGTAAVAARRAAPGSADFRRRTGRR